MKPVFKCDYCKFMGTEEEVKKHEPVCMDNYDRKSCYTCIHKKIKTDNNKYLYVCKASKEVPEGSIFEFCPQYERKEEKYDLIGGLFSGLFG